MGNNKGKVQVKAKVKAKKTSIKPKMGRGTGGAITATLIAKVNKDRTNNKNSNG